MQQKLVDAKLYGARSFQTTPQKRKESILVTTRKSRKNSVAAVGNVLKGTKQQSLSPQTSSSMKSSLLKQGKKSKISENSPHKEIEQGSINALLNIQKSQNNLFRKKDVQRRRASENYTNYDLKRETGGRNPLISTFG